MIYEPAEDSFLMSRILKENIPNLLNKNPDLKFLEIGTGSGIHLETAKSLGIKLENIFSSDIDKKSVLHCRSLGFNCIHSDLFDKIPKIKFDLIIFNPPYLPEDSREPKSSRLATTGGKKGNEIILLFLKQAKNYLNKNGKIFLITSSLAKDVDFKKLNYKAKEIGFEKLFFEKLFIWELKIIV
ncbi:methyltransferase [Candidatus Pacearchaeota archaeon]|jgi:HemK-related putative methylase|nr:methyltransferase [Candidatus Pacearchaeota archaeon]